MSNAGQDINAFCSALLGGGDGTGDDRLAGYSVSVFSLPDKVTRWIPAEVPEAIASAVYELTSRQPSAVHAVYIGLGFVPNEIAKRKEEANKGQRAEARDIAGIPGLWADIDIAGHGHKKNGLPPDLESAKRILEACGVPPTLIVHTGNGVQAWWAFSEPIIFESEDEKTSIAQLARDWNLTLKLRARETGGWDAGVDSVHDLTRLMRAPGSINTKGPDGQHGGPADGHRPVTVLEWNGWAYDPDDFREFLASDEALKTLTAVKAVSGADAGSLAGVDLAAVWRRASSAASRERGYMPPLVALMIESGFDKVEDTWHGRRPDLGGDQSAYDAALTRLLCDGGASPEVLAEAIMCRRLLNRDTDKVDPAKRTDYVVRTVLNVTAMAKAANAERNELAGKMQAIRDMPVVVESTPEPATPVNVPEPATPAALTVVREPGPPAADTTPEPGEPETIAQGSPVLDVLNQLLIPKKFREAGVSTIGMEHRDYGENQKGRLIFQIPDGFRWAGSGPALYRPGKPLKAEWYRKDIFEIPKGFRTTLERDAMIPSRTVGKNKEEWEAVISELTSHWERDSSGSDLATAVKEWLRDYLIVHAATTIEAEAVELKRAYMIDTGNWGANGATPRVLILFSSFAEYVSAQPGGRQYAGRAARNLVDYLHMKEVRPRLAGPDGVVRRRTNWFEIEESQFTMDDWGAVLEAAQDRMTSSEERRLRAIKGGMA